MPRPPQTLLRQQLAKIGDDWTLLRTGASRWAIHKLRRRYPAFEFRAERTSWIAGDAGIWNIEARRLDNMTPET